MPTAAEHIRKGAYVDWLEVVDGRFRCKLCVARGCRSFVWFKWREDDGRATTTRYTEHSKCSKHSNEVESEEA